MATYIIKKNNVFTMNRGDTAIMNFDVDLDLPEGAIIDKLYLGITEPNQYFEDALIKKTFEVEIDTDTTDPIEDTNITFTRGDTFRVAIDITDADGNIFTPSDGDIIRFAMKKYYSDTECLIEKVIPNDTLILELEPSDTKNLDCGRYVYDIELTYANGDVDTFIKGTLKLTEEVE